MNRTSPSLVLAVVAIEQDCIHTKRDRAFTESIVATLSADQQEALLRLVQWIGQGKRSPAEVHAECERTFAGDRRFADAVAMAMESIRHRPRQSAANDGALSLVDRFQL